MPPVRVLAQKKAQQSICKFKVSAIGLNAKGEVVAKAINRPRFSHKGGGIHAEMSVMKFARKKGIKTILICRVSTCNGELLPIDPCPRCAATAKKLGIKIVSI